MDTQAIENKRQTLPDLLYQLAAADEGLRDLTPEVSAQLIEDLATKVDSYYLILEKMDGEIDRLSKRMEDLAETRKTLQNNKESLKNLMLFHMKEKGFEKLPGNQYVASLISRKTVEFTLISEPDSMTARQWPGFVKREFSWDKRALTQAIKDFPSQYQELGKLVEKQHLKFSVKKDL